MKKIFALILLFCFLQNLSAQDQFEPVEHSGKWIEGHELAIKTLDSVRVKINFLRHDNDVWIFEAEFLNQSLVDDILIAPETFKLRTEFNTVKGSCPTGFIWNQQSPLLTYSGTIDVEKVVKKNTLEPKQSLYGLFFVKHCRYSKNLLLSLPIKNQVFEFVFLRKV